MRGFLLLLPECFIYYMTCVIFLCQSFEFSPRSLRWRCVKSSRPKKKPEMWHKKYTLRFEHARKVSKKKNGISTLCHDCYFFCLFVRFSVYFPIWLWIFAFSPSISPIKLEVYSMAMATTLMWFCLYKHSQWFHSLTGAKHTHIHTWLYTHTHTYAFRFLRSNTQRNWAKKKSNKRASDEENVNRGAKERIRNSDEKNIWTNDLLLFSRWTHTIECFHTINFIHVYFILFDFIFPPMLACSLHIWLCVSLFLCIHVGAIYWYILILVLLIIDGDGWTNNTNIYRFLYRAARVHVWQKRVKDEMRWDTE